MKSSIKTTKRKIQTITFYFIVTKLLGDKKGGPQAYNFYKEEWISSSVGVSVTSPRTTKVGFDFKILWAIAATSLAETASTPLTKSDGDTVLPRAA